MEWPATSPNLNPIENLWAIVKHHLNRHPHCPLTEAEMEKVVQEEWDAITDEEVKDVIDSMPTRVQAVLAARGGHKAW